MLPSSGQPKKRSDKNDDLVAYEDNNAGNKKRNVGCFAALGGLLGCLLLPLILLFAPVILGMTSVNNLVMGIQTSISNVISPPPPVATTTSSQTIVQSVLPLGQLVSVSLQLAKAEIDVSVRQGALNACGYSAKHVAVGSVEAGIDLSTIESSNVVFEEENDRYILNLPAPMLTGCHIEYIRQYERSTTACSVDWDEARILANTLAIREFRNDALEGGVLARAEREAGIALETFVRALTGKDVVIVFDDSTSAVTPSTCQAPPPDGWNYNETDNSWTKP